MAVSYVWPGSLPQSVLSGYSEDGGVLIIRSPMDAGPAKQRRRGNRPAKLGVKLLMTSAQVETFEAFVGDTIRGTARFGFPHPRTKTQAEVRIIPEDGGKLFSLDDFGLGHWQVSMSLEVLP